MENPTHSYWSVDSRGIIDVRNGKVYSSIKHMEGDTLRPIKSKTNLRKKKKGSR